MPRVPRRLQHADGLCYHVMSRGHNRETIFRDDADRLAFLARLANVKRRFDFRLLHYCLMDNHVHLILRPRTPAALTSLMAGLLRSYVHYFHRRDAFVGHLWQGRFKGPAIQDGEYLLSAGRYVERNPVAAGLTRTPWDYRWSSSRHYACGEADPLVDDSPELVELAPDADHRREMWRAFLIHDDSRESAIAEADWCIGTPEFRARLTQHHGRPTPRRRGRPTSNGLAG